MTPLSFNMSPDAVELQTKYENARSAIGEGYHTAAKYFTPRYGFTEPDQMGGVTETRLSIAEEQAQFVAFARYIASEVRKDLDETLKILEKSNVGAKTEPTEVLISH